MRSRSIADHAFSMIPTAEIPRSSFDRSFGHKTTFDAGLLIPVFLDEALPGDTFNVRMHAFARLATPIFPIMDNLYLDSFFFAVPYRLLWDNWEKFNGAQDNPGDSTDFLIPIITTPAGGWTTHSLGDYFGLPVVNTLTGGMAAVSALPFRAYAAIYNEWFRDQNIIPKIAFSKGNGPDNIATSGYAIVRKRGKRHDYFTSCLPWPQKGSAVTLPMVGNATVRTSASELVTGGTAGMMLRLNTGGVVTGGKALSTGAGGAGSIMSESSAAAAAVTGIYPSNLFADMTSVTAATINQLRQAFQIQRLLERDARGGTRYTEIVHSHFGVISPDARMQRPEYLGGGSSRVNITSVPQTSESTTESPQGNLAAFGTVNASGHGFVKSFTEHCIVMGIIMVRADLTYQQGLHRMWSRRTRFDHYWPALAHIGEQAVLTQEIYCDGSATDATVFGYQERFGEYRYKPSMLSGLMRSNVSVGNVTIDPWHVAQDFATAPTLNASFIGEDPPIDRVIAVPDEPHFIADIHFDFRAARPMPMYGVPGMIDHF